MIKPKQPINEQERIHALESYKILDTITEEEYEQLTMIASQICNTPIALISLIDKDRQWFKSHHGLDATETPRDLAFCAHAINEPEKVFVVPNAFEDERFHDNPLVTDNPNVVFYAGAPLNTEDGFSLGTLCVIDDKPRTITLEQQKALKGLADQVISQFELRKKNNELLEAKSKLEQTNRDLDNFTYRLSHDLQTPLRGILNLVTWLKEDHQVEFSEEVFNKIELISERSNYMVYLIKSMLEYAKATKFDLTFVPINLQNVITKAYDNSPHKTCSIHFENCDQTILQSEIGMITCFQNLISNSIKYGDKTNCSIHISLDEKPKEYHISFRDNGPGIEKEFKHKIFEIFETLNTKTEDSSGIGLATVRAVLQKLEGSIELNTENNKGGAEFIIRLKKKSKSLDKN